MRSIKHRLLVILRPALTILPSTAVTGGEWIHNLFIPLSRNALQMSELLRGIFVRPSSSVGASLAHTG